MSPKNKSKPDPSALSAKVKDPDLPEDWKRLVEATIQKGVKIDPSQIKRILELPDKRKVPGVEGNVLWVEKGNDKAAYQHMSGPAKMHPSRKLSELMEAATKVEYPWKYLESDRPIFALTFYGTPVLVAITVSSNGYIVGANRSSKETFMEKNMSEEDFRELGCWPLHEGMEP